MNSSDLAELLAALQSPTHRGNSFGQGTGIVPDPKMSDPTTAPEVAAKLRDNYLTSLLAAPQSTWSEAEKLAVRAEVQRVLKSELGY